MQSIVFFAGYFPTHESINSGLEFLDLFKKHYSDCLFFIGFNPAKHNQEFISALKKSKLKFKYEITPTELVIDSDASAYQTALRIGRDWFKSSENSNIKSCYFFHSKGSTNHNSHELRKIFIKFFSNREFIDNILSTPLTGSYSLFLGKKKISHFENKIKYFLDAKYFYTYLYFHTIFSVKGSAIKHFFLNCNNSFYSRNLQDRYFFERDFLHMIWGQGLYPQAYQLVDWNDGFKTNEINLEKDVRNYMTMINTDSHELDKTSNKPHENLEKLYNQHRGNISQKFQSYLISYERNLSKFRDKEINLLEIGVQNGGSLEIWSKYFTESKKILGVDINPECAKINFDDEKIRLVIGSVISNETYQEIIKISNQFDIIIDDGSHLSSEIISTFYNYFPLIKPGGVYIIEDMHASYWEKYDGGLHNQRSAHAFFKNLTDALNSEHLEPEENIESIFKTWLTSKKIKNFLSSNKIYSIQFQNSMIIIEKSSVDYSSELGDMVFAGKIARVEKSILRHRKTNNLINQ